MNNKILIVAYVPVLNQEYDCFIPIGKTVGTVKKIILDTIGNLNEIGFNNEVRFYDKDSGVLYDNDDEYIKNTKLKNGTKLILI